MMVAGRERVKGASQRLHRVAFKTSRLQTAVPFAWPRFSSQIARIPDMARVRLQHFSFVSQVAPRYGGFWTYWGGIDAIKRCYDQSLYGLPPLNVHRKCPSFTFSVLSDSTTDRWTREVQRRRSFFIGSWQDLAIRGRKQRGSPRSVESSEFTSI